MNKQQSKKRQHDENFLTAPLPGKEIAHNQEQPTPHRVVAPLHAQLTRRLELEIQNKTLRRAYAALETSCQTYKQLYELSPIGQLTLSQNGQIIKANQACAKLLDMESERLINQDFAHFISSKDTENWHRHFLNAKQHKGKQDHELLIQRVDGSHFNARLNCLYVNANNTQPILHITLTDIDAHKHIEEEQQISALAFKSQEAFMVTDAEKTVLRVNQAFNRVTGYSAEEVVGRTAFFFHFEAYDNKLYQNICASLANDGYWQGAILNKHKNGETLPLWLKLSAVTDPNKGVTYYVASLTDVTQQKQVEKVLIETCQALEKQVATKHLEIEKIKEEYEEVNTALDVLLKHRETDKCDAQTAFSQEAEETILPFLEKLKKILTESNQHCLIDMIESNLQHLLKSYGDNNSLLSLYRHLTPIETQVASMVRQGLSTKHIAAALNLAPGTVSIHRKHIRKKLGMGGKADNLYNHLISLT